MHPDVEIDAECDISEELDEEEKNDETPAPVTIDQRIVDVVQQKFENNALERKITRKS